LLLKDNDTTTEDVGVETDHIHATSSCNNKIDLENNDVKEWKNTTTTMDLDHCNRTVSGPKKKLLWSLYRIDVQFNYK
jgi:hypothetical protein